MSKKCLVVDDVDVSRYASRMILEKLGFEVLDAVDASGCLDMVMKSRLDVILLDWHLRKESGLDLIAKIRAAPGHDRTPVIVFSGVEDQGADIVASQAGANAFIRKPTTKDKIETELRKLGLV